MLPLENKQLNAEQNIAAQTPLTSASVFEKIAFYGLIITVVLTAIPYGTVTIEAKLLFVILSCVFASFRILDGIINKNFEFSNFFFFLPLLGIILLAFVQIIPFRGATDVFSHPEISNSSISLDVYETKNFILIFASLLLTYEVLLRYTNSKRRMLILILTVFVVGLASALFGFVRMLFFGAENNVLAPFITEKVRFAQFVNRNHFAFLMEMTLGLLLGLFIKADLAKYLKPIFWLMIGTSVLAIILANSRGGILCTVGLGFFTIILYFATRQNRSERDAHYDENTPKVKSFVKTTLMILMISALFFGVTIFTISFVGGDAVVSRIETVQNEVEQSEGKYERLEIWQATIELFKANPVAGVGFGAYQVGITPYDKSSGRLTLMQAHNDYLEVLASGGIIGFALGILFFGGLIKRIVEQLKSESRFRRAICFGATVGIFGVLLHSIVDFGLHVLVNALIFVILIVIATAKINSSERDCNALKRL